MDGEHDGKAYEQMGWFGWLSHYFLEKPSWWNGMKRNGFLDRTFPLMFLFEEGSWGLVLGKFFVCLFWTPDIYHVKGDSYTPGEHVCFFKLRWAQHEPTKNPSNLNFSRWWQLKHFLIFTPKLGEDFQFDEHIFQMGGKKPPTSLFSTIYPWKLRWNLKSPNWKGKSSFRPPFWSSMLVFQGVSFFLAKKGEPSSASRHSGRMVFWLTGGYLTSKMWGKCTNWKFSGWFPSSMGAKICMIYRIY